MNRSLQLLQKHARKGLSDLIEQLGEKPPSWSDERKEKAVKSLLTTHQEWLFHERLDLHASIDIAVEEDQARFLNWWVHHMPTEYSAPAEAIDWKHLAAPYNPDGGAFSTLVTNFMRKSYVLNKKLREEFDLTTRFGRVGYIDRFYRRQIFAEKLDDTPYIDHLITELCKPADPDESEQPVNRFAALVLRRYKLQFNGADDMAEIEARFAGVLNAHATELLYLYQRLPDGIRPVNYKLSLRSISNRNLARASADAGKGANLVGYAHGAFGMGEHVRMSARALATWTDRFAIVDVNAYAHERQPEPDILEWSNRTQLYSTNIFHVNADAMAGALTTIGPALGQGRYNIGYWAWELSKVPGSWQQSIDFVDEIWAPSRFIQEAFQEVTDKPVTYMPLCVELSFDRWKRRRYFGLPDGKFLFLYYFDSYSYFQRKNPFAALRAFQLAFPDRNDVGLVIKTQNARADSPEWLELLDLARTDPRIYILNRSMTKGEVLSLQAECDCFVSLHRSEGFGRGPAEAMWLGKPVIVTAYSGNMDFTLPENSLLVDYELIRVKPAEYPFFHKQVWAQPDEAHAASLMRRLVEEPGLAQELGGRGSRLMREEFSSKQIGKRYFDRLQEIGTL